MNLRGLVGGVVVGWSVIRHCKNMFLTVLLWGGNLNKLQAE